MKYDVVIVGASISGCAAALHLSRAGLSVALLEKHRALGTPKHLCGHFLLGGAQDPLQRLGLWDDLVATGAGTGGLAIWTEHGWLDRSRADAVPPFIDVRRSTLDPLLRQAAADSPGVELLLGHTLTELVRQGDRVVGVRARSLDGTTRRLDARLVVGADGHRSRTAELAGVVEQRYPNSRAFLYGYYRDVPWDADGQAALWWHGDDWAVLTPTDGGLTEVALMPVRSSVPAVAGSAGASYIERYFRRLPDAPELLPEQRVSKVVASLDYPLVRRDPTPVGGLGLVGDAALTTDPAPAAGCTWALLSAQWLADSVADPLRSGSPVDQGLRGYRRQRRRLEREFFFMRSDAATGTANPVQRMLREAAVHDPVTAERLLRVGMQVAPTTTLLRPRVLGRAYVERRRGRRARTVAAPGVPAPVS